MKAKFILWVSACLLLANIPQRISAQVDVTQVLADTKTYMFNDGKNNVKSYVSEQLQSQTSCCGDESLYMEVRIDPSGYAKEVKVLTGKNECLKKSAMDIVKNIKWNTAELKGPKTVYFEVKPSIACDGRNNTYVAIPVTNNPLLAESGAAPAQPAATEPVVAQPVVATTTPAPQPVVSQPQPTTQPAVAVAQPQPAPAQPQVVPTQPQVAPRQSSPAAPTTPAAAPKKSKEETQREIEQLQAQLNELKAAKEREAATRYEKERQEAAAKREAEQKIEQSKVAVEADARSRREEQERKRREMEARNKPKKQEDENPYGYGKTYDYDAPAPEDAPAQSAKGGKAVAVSGKRGIEGDTAKTKVDPAISEQIALERRIKELEVKIKEEELIRQKNAQEQANLYKQIEESRRKQREIEEIEARKKEQAELDRLAAEKKLAEERQKQNQDAIERIMKEIGLLQEEISKKTQEIEKAKSDAIALDSKRLQKEQEIQMNRAVREANMQPVQPVPGIAIAPVPMPAKGDTSKMALLLYQVQMLTQTVNALQTRLTMMGSTPAQTTTVGRGLENTDPRNTVKGSNKGTSSSPAIVSSSQARTAANDDSWKKVDYAYVKSGEDGMANKEMIEKSIAENKRLAGATAPKANTNSGTATAANDHEDMHKNMPGPVLSQPQYVEGEQAMKDQIRNQLHMSGVCGLAQAAFEVTVTPRGDVVAYRILAANTQQVYSLMPGILSGLKFKPSNNRFNQTTYLEFKTDIRCDENPTGGQLDQVPNYIDSPVKKQ